MEGSFCGPIPKSVKVEGGSFFGQPCVLGSAMPEIGKTRFKNMETYLNCRVRILGSQAPDGFSYNEGAPTLDSAETLSPWGSSMEDKHPADAVSPPDLQKNLMDKLQAAGSAMPNVAHALVGVLQLATQGGSGSNTLELGEVGVP